MADATLGKLHDLLADGAKKEARLAAFRVVSEVSSAKDKAGVRALLAALDDADPDVRIGALEALGRLKAEESLDRLKHFARTGGPELEAAVMSASQLGAKGAKAMGAIMDEVGPGLRVRIANVLAKAGAATGLVVTAHALLDDNPILVESAARSLAKEVPSYSAGQRHALAKFLIEAIEEKKYHGPRAEASMVRVLGNLHEAKAEELFWSRISPPSSLEVRVAALNALGAHTVPGADGKIQKLVACARENDFQLVAPALVLLNNVPKSAKNDKIWIGLLDAPDVATRSFTLDRLDDSDKEDVIKALLPSLQHADRNFRERVFHYLLERSKGRKHILDRLLGAETVDPMWNLGRALAAKEIAWSKDEKARLFKTACEYHDADDRRAAPLWTLLREIDSAGTRDQLLETAQSLRKKKKYAEALSYFRLLAQDPACAEDVRFELACVGLKTSAHNLSADERKADVSLMQLARLLQNPAFGLFDHLNKTKWLDPDDLLYIGFHFAEQTHRSRDFGKQVLDLLIKRSPKSELAKQAKRKLKAEGF